jgi:hypothetical protein
MFNYGEVVVGTEPVTVKLTAGLVIPSRDAVMSTVPAARPLAKAIQSMVAILLSELAQVTFVVRFVVVPSEYVPVA